MSPNNHRKPSNVQIFPNLQELSLAAAERFASLANQAIRNSGRFTVALSGGSTPKALHAVLSGVPFRDRIDWLRVYFFWGDERFVPLDHQDSNYRMAQETLLSKVPVPQKNIFPIVAETLSAREAAAEYESKLRNFFGDGTLPCFDLILLGMGEDGHTASLFPYTAALKESIRWVTENSVEKLNTDRITMTVSLINNAANILFLISGASKANALKAVLQGPYDPDRLPAQLIRPHSGELLFLVDEDVGAGLRPASTESTQNS
jgi:6-phosphogluconolactonase